MNPPIIVVSEVNDDTNEATQDTIEEVSNQVEETNETVEAVEETVESLVEAEVEEQSWHETINNTLIQLTGAITIMAERITQLESSPQNESDSTLSPTEPETETEQTESIPLQTSEPGQESTESSETESTTEQQESQTELTLPPEAKKKRQGWRFRR